MFIGLHFFKTFILLCLVITLMVLTHMRRTSSDQILRKYVQSPVTKNLSASEAVFIDPIITEKEYKKMLEKCTYPPIETYKEFKNFLYSGESGCEDANAFGGTMLSKRRVDGNKMVCMEKFVKPIRDKCIVVSVGINRDWSFDYAMDNYGCKVYSLDPTINLTRHRRGKNIFFEPVGLGTKDQKPVRGNKKTWNLLTYSSLLDFLGLRNQVIDYLKVDIEAAEMGTFKQIFNEYPHVLRYVKQIGMELHLGRRYKQYYGMMQKMACLGFKLFYIEANESCRRIVEKEKVTTCFEVVWTNEKFSNKN